jgi:hypothetical protein
MDAGWLKRGKGERGRVNGGMNRGTKGKVFERE